MSFTPSKYQKAVYDFVKNGKGNAIVGAVAGSGKTTTILEAIKQIPEEDSVLLLAFNKSIVQELSAKVGFMDNVEVKTLHGLGMSAITKSMKVKVEPQKYRGYINRGVKDGALAPTKQLEAADFREWKANIKKLVELIRVNLCRSYGGAKNLANKHNIHLIDNELSIVNKTIKYGKKDLSIIDFTDMIYFPNAFDLKVETYDWVFIDECQDLNAAQRNLFLKCIKPNTGRFVAVGDKRQAIYGFAGADAESFDLLRNLPNTKYLPLSVCYRCGKNIVAEAKGIVPSIEAFNKSKDGEVDNVASYENVQDGDMVVCRVTAPLVELCMTYIAKGVKAYVKGRDIGKSLISLLENTRKTNIAEAFKVLQRESVKILNREVERLSCDPEEALTAPRYLSFLDKIEALEVLSRGLTQTRQLIGRINTIFSDNSKNGICLSTIHKSKGLEADNVFILRPDKLYLAAAMKLEWQKEQEENLVYVAITRAKKYLGYIQDFGNTDKWSNDTKKVHEISLNPHGYAIKDPKFFCSILVHEMVHLFIHDNTEKPPRSGYHCKKWGSKMKEVGLYPSNTGEVGGKETGQQMTHYIIEEGLFNEVYERMDKNILLPFRRFATPPKPKKKKSKLKYTCPECSANVWGKIGLKIKCYGADCDSLMECEED